MNPLRTLHSPPRTRARSRGAPACRSPQRFARLPTPAPARAPRPLASTPTCTASSAAAVDVGVLRQAWVGAAAYALAPPLLLDALQPRLAAASSSWARRSTRGSRRRRGSHESRSSTAARGARMRRSRLFLAPARPRPRRPPAGRRGCLSAGACSSAALAVSCRPRQLGAASQVLMPPPRALGMWPASAKTSPAVIGSRGVPAGRVLRFNLKYDTGRRSVRGHQRRLPAWIQIPPGGGTPPTRARMHATVRGPVRARGHSALTTTLVRRRSGNGYMTRNLY